MTPRERILANPLRTLAIFANTTLKEQIAAADEAKAYARIGETLENPLTLDGLEPKVDTSDEAILNAETMIALPKEREKYNMLWFHHGTDISQDREAISLLNKGDREFTIWQKRNDSTAHHNIMVALLIEGDVAKALEHAQEAIQKEHDIRLLLWLLINDCGVPSEDIFNALGNQERWHAIATDMVGKEYREKVEQAISDAEHTYGGEPEYSKEKVKELYAAYDTLQELKPCLPEGSPVYQMLANDIALYMAKHALVIGISKKSSESDKEEAAKAMLFAKEKAQGETWSEVVDMMRLLPDLFPKPPVTEVQKDSASPGCIESFVAFLFIFFMVIWGRTCNHYSTDNSKYKYRFTPKIEIPKFDPKTLDFGRDIDLPNYDSIIKEINRYRKIDVPNYYEKQDSNKHQKYLERYTIPETIEAEERLTIEETEYVTPVLHDEEEEIEVEVEVEKASDEGNSDTDEYTEEQEEQE